MTTIYQSESFIRACASVHLASENLETSKKQMDSIKQSLDIIHAQFLAGIEVLSKASPLHAENVKTLENETNLLKIIAELDSLDPFSEDNDGLRQSLYACMSTEEYASYMLTESVQVPSLTIVDPTDPLGLIDLTTFPPLILVDPDTRCHARCVVKPSKNSENSYIGVCGTACYFKDFKYNIYLEDQCSKNAVNGVLCKSHLNKKNKAETEGYLKTGTGDTGKWSGVIGDIPLPKCHYIGSKWSTDLMNNVSSPSSSSS